MVPLTNEQESALNGLVQFKKQTQSLGGYAGTGKTTLISHLKQHDKCKNFAVCAFTGKAANILRRKQLPASTIHSLIYEPEKDDEGRIVLYNGVPNFILKRSLEADGIIVDEASMVGRDIYKDLQHFGLPLIFVGDHGQLEPVSEGMNLMQNPDFTLETIHRNAGEIAFFAEHIRRGNRPASWKSQGKVAFVSRYDAHEYFLKSDQIICAFNKTRVQVNKFVRQQLGRTKADWPEPEDKIMCLRNNREKMLFNGMQGIVQTMHNKPKNKFVFESYGQTFDTAFDPTQFGLEKYTFTGERSSPDPFDFAYCITAHKSQGDEWPVVMVLEQVCKRWDHKRWAYTAASRAREGVVWVEGY